jgi:hypothetical protein
VKKWYIILAVFLLAIIIGIAVPVVQGSKIKTYMNEIALHSAVHKVYNDTKGVTTEGSVRLCDANVYYFEKAITNTGLVYRFFKPDVSEMSSVTVTYHDGAEFKIFDAGKTKNNKDLAYIFYTYKGHTDVPALKDSAEQIHTYKKVLDDYGLHILKRKEHLI